MLLTYLHIFAFRSALSLFILSSLPCSESDCCDGAAGLLLMLTESAEDGEIHSG